MARDLGIKSTAKSPFYFLSYNSEDQERVKVFAEFLDKNKIPLWYDNGIEIGDKWEKTIADRICDCESVIMFISKGIFQKPESYVHKEFEMARDYFEKKIIIVLLDKIAKKDVPRQYVSWWIDITHMQCINAAEYGNVAECAIRVMQAIGYDVQKTEPKEEPKAEPEKAEPKEEPKAEPEKAEPKKETKAESAVTPSAAEKITFDNGDVYEGGIVNGSPHGRGKITFKSGDIYEGDFDNGKMAGKGKYTWLNGEVYEGDFVDGKRTGKGKYSWPDGDTYEGDFTDGKRTGKGKFRWVFGNTYEGDFVDGKRTGKGKFKSIFGEVYEGDFADGKMTGKGKYTWLNGDTYEGDFVDGKRTGKGKFTYKSGDAYEGDFVDGKYHGAGKFVSADGALVQDGKWENGNFVV